MALKFEIQGTALTVTDTVTSEIKIDRPAKETYYQSHELDNGNIVLYDTSGVNPYSSYIYKNTLTGSVDSNDVQFTAETFRTFVHENLGKSSPSESGGEKGHFFGGVSQTIYTDSFVEFLWDSLNKQLRYTTLPNTPLGGWGWHDATAVIYKSNGAFISNDDISAGNNTFYFTNGGALDTNFNAVDYATKVELTLTKENFSLGFPSYHITLILGDVNNVKYKIEII